MERFDLRAGMSPEASAAAAAAVRRGGLVAFPTETVYGLGATATDEEAIRRIFAAKGRPPDKPVSVLVADTEQARRLSARWTAEADELARAFWPGPLTLVVRAKGEIPSSVTAGGETVGLRVPDHPIALALLREVGPLAAPSANRSGEAPPVDADGVIAALGESAIDVLLDGGPSAMGRASTVLDLTTDPPRVLRPGPTVDRIVARLDAIRARR